MGQISDSVISVITDFCDISDLLTDSVISVITDFSDISDLITDSVISVISVISDSVISVISDSVISVINDSVIPASEATTASKQPRRSDLTSDLKSVTSITYISMCILLIWYGSI